MGLEGRPPVRYRTAGGEWINNLEVTHALGGIGLAQYTLHQDAGGALRCVYRGAAGDGERVRAALEGLFGAGRAVEVRRMAGRF